MGYLSYLILGNRTYNLIRHDDRDTQKERDSFVEDLRRTQLRVGKEIFFRRVGYLPSSLLDN